VGTMRYGEFGKDYLFEISIQITNIKTCPVRQQCFTMTYFFRSNWSIQRVSITKHQYAKGCPQKRSNLVLQANSIIFHDFNPHCFHVSNDRQGPLSSALRAIPIEQDKRI